MNTFVFRIPTKTANLDELESLADVLKSFTGERVEVTEYFEIHTASKRAAGALEALFEQQAIGQGLRFEASEPEAAITTPKKAGKVRGNWKPPARERRIWDVIVNDDRIEQITVSEKDRRLAAGLYEPGTVLHHPKVGYLRVIGDKGGAQWTAPRTDEEAVTVQEVENV
jgi:hypothetical protein